MKIRLECCFVLIRRVLLSISPPSTLKMMTELSPLLISYSVKLMQRTKRPNLRRTLISDIWYTQISKTEQRIESIEAKGIAFNVLS